MRPRYSSTAVPVHLAIGWVGELMGGCVGACEWVLVNRGGCEVVVCSVVQYPDPAGVFPLVLLLWDAVLHGVFSF